VNGELEKGVGQKESFVSVGVLRRNSSLAETHSKNMVRKGSPKGSKSQATIEGK